MLDVRALREREELLRSVLADQSEIISRFKPDGTLVFVNDAFCRFFGKRSEQVLAKQWQPHALTEDVALIEAKLATLTVDQGLVWGAAFRKDDTKLRNAVDEAMGGYCDSIKVILHSDASCSDIDM
mgnify:CR=1 FL=1